VDILSQFIAFPNMRRHLLTGVLAAAGAASVVAAAGTPVLVPRASTTLTPITVTGNGMQSNCTEQETELTFLTAFYQGSERFYIRGVDYQPGPFSRLIHWSIS
jgi:hypothetical protein